MRNVRRNTNAPASGLGPGACSGRRGVLLLVVLALLVLFALIGVTFVLVAGQHYRATKMALRHEQYGDDSRRLCDAVLAQIVRDTNNTQSVLRGHSLLNDLYGNDGIKMDASGGGSIVPSGVVPTNGQLVDLTVTFPPMVSPYFAHSTDPTGVPKLVPGLPTAGLPLSLTQINTLGYYNGCVLTMLDGAAANRSTRIVGWRYNGATYTIRVMAFEGVPVAKLISNRPTAILINGRPFNGTGFGFNPEADPTMAPTLLNANQEITLSDGTTKAAVPYALLPNPVFTDPRRMPTDDSIQFPTGAIRIADDVGNLITTYLEFGGIGGGDEDYDAGDAQNMLLAHLPLKPTTSADIIPSLHRPDTIAYLRNTTGYTTLPAGSTERDLLDRQMSLRPATSGFNHPGFTGSNPGPPFNPITGPWDVDNDGDGVKESIWVDIGLPVQTAPDGRTFKPLAAILVLDQDSRLNVNAHGNVAQANATYSTPIPQGTSPNLTITDYLYSNTGMAPATVRLPRGSGYGPAEINLLPIFPPLTALTDYQTFFQGSALAGEGRYGELGRTAAVPTVYPYPMPGRTDHTPMALADDLLGKAKGYGLPSNYYGAALSGYGSPSDVWGRGVVGIDYAGQPIYSLLKQTPMAPATFGSISNSTTNQPDAERPNSPYDFNLSRNRIRSAEATPTSNDNAFTVAELERILRRFDGDAAELPDRLRRLVDPNGTNPNDLARLITTDSFDLPGPGILMTRDAAVRLKNDSTTTPPTLPTSLHIVDLLKRRLIAGGCGAVDAEIVKMLPPELIAGVRFDLNRPFGNGEDDDVNGIVDEPTNAEFSANGEVPSLWSSVFSTLPTGMDLNHDGMLDANDLYARQLYARQLYALMMTLMPDTAYAWARDGSNAALVAAQQRELTSRRVAQWAINVVDFRDPDSIMTPFEYDANPWNGWDLDGLIDAGSPDNGHQDRRLVWGCESPELLLTETLAMHDRRVEDTAADPSGKLRNDPSMVDDEDLDQQRVPQGSAFFELYCPRNANPSQHVYSADLYTAGRLDLGRMAPAGAGVAYPVWRIAITSSTLNATTGPANNINTRVTQQPDLANFDPPTSLGTCPPEAHSIFSPSSHTSGVAAANPPDRIVWFTNQSPTGNPEANLIYYNAAGTSTLLNPGQYAVVGPRQSTFVGMNATNLSAQSITLNPAGPSVTYTPANGIAPNQIATSYQALPIICTSGSAPPGWNTTLVPPNHDIGVSISEPLFSVAYYTQPQALGLASGLNDTYSGIDISDQPLDGGTNGSPLANAPLAQDGLWSTGMKENYKTAFLQRLANPREPFNAVTNPYITVDWQPIDLLVFNGEKLQPSPNGDPDDLVFQTPPANQLAGSRERSAIGILWNSSPQKPTTVTSAKGATGAVFDYNINQSLGYLNKSLGTPWMPPSADLAAYAGIPDPTLGNPFHWLTWNNRPFVSNMELLQVPATSAEQLLREFSSAPAVSSNPYAEPYIDLNMNSIYDAGDTFTDLNGSTQWDGPLGEPYNDANFNGQFDPSESFTDLNGNAQWDGPLHSPCKHLLNFLLSSNGSGGFAPYFYRLLEYVHVPSRFVGTETFLNPDPARVPFEFQAPFNKISNYRDPGRVNINTIPGLAGGPPISPINPIWDAILNNGPGPRWDEIVASRRGDTVLGANVTTPDPTRSSVLARPFRSAGGALFSLPGTTAPNNEIEATLLRPNPVTPSRPLFQFPLAQAQPYNNPDRNSYFRYQPLTRLSNLLTTRSNVYAIWVTIGYFEVTPTPGGPHDAHPDGWNLGQELGADSGEVVRHRAFYIYDRTIPVGFEPGHDHNYEDGLLLRRFIE